MKKITFIFLWVIIVLLSIIAITSIILMIFGVKVAGVNIGLVILVLELCYLALSFGTVKVEEVAGLFFFNDPIKDLTPGLYLALLGIISVRKEKGTQFQYELPADPENIYREEGKIPEGMFPPIRIKFGQPSPQDIDLKDDPYNIAMVCEVVPIVSWKIKSMTIFLKTMGSIANCRQILSDKAIAVFGDDFSNVTPAKALLNLSATSQKLEDQLREETKDWGIEIKDAYVKPFIFSHSLNKSVIDVSEANQKAKATRITADAEKYKIKAAGSAEADVKQLLLEAQAIGTTKLAKVGKTTEGQIIIWMQTMAEAYKNAQYSIIPSGDLMASIAGIKEMLDKIKGGK